MSINIRNAIMIFVGALLLAIPVGAIIMTDGISKSDVAMNPLIQNASALKPTETKPKTEAPKTEPAPVVEEVKAPEPAPVVVAPEPTPAPQPQTAFVAGNCESFRPLVQKYFGNATDAAMIVMSKESSCNPTAVSATNDHGLFQLNGMPIYDPEANIAAAVQKYLSPRRGSTPNFSAWYAVCTPNLVPKYAGIWCS
jgi:hypothetical protein